MRKWERSFGHCRIRLEWFIIHKWSVNLFHHCCNLPLSRKANIFQVPQVLRILQGGIKVLQFRTYKSLCILMNVLFVAWCELSYCLHKIVIYSICIFFPKHIMLVWSFHDRITFCTSGLFSNIACLILEFLEFSKLKALKVFNYMNITCKAVKICIFSAKKKRCYGNTNLFKAFW